MLICSLVILTSNSDLVTVNLILLSLWVEFISKIKLSKTFRNLIILSKSLLIKVRMRNLQSLDLILIISSKVIHFTNRIVFSCRSASFAISSIINSKFLGFNRAILVRLNRYFLHRFIKNVQSWNIPSFSSIQQVISRAWTVVFAVGWHTRNLRRMLI